MTTMLSATQAGQICHESAQALFCSTFCGLSHFPNNMVLFFLFASASSPSVYVHIVVHFNRFHSAPFYPICMLRRRLVVANRRITIYLYLYTKKISNALCPEPEQWDPAWYSWNYTQTYHRLCSVWSFGTFSCFKLHIFTLAAGEKQSTDHFHFMSVTAG